MNRPCPDMQDRIADYALGALDPEQAEAVRKHLSECSGCRQYLQSLKEQNESLVELGRELGSDMAARQDRVIEALRDVAPAERAFPFIGGFIKTAVAAVLLLGLGIAVGRWTAPRQIDVEQLRADLQTSVLARVDQRLQAEAQQRTELTLQKQKDLVMLAQQCTGLENLMKGRFTELVDLIEAGRNTDRWRVENALEEMGRRTGLGLQAIAVRAGDRATTVQN